MDFGEIWWRSYRLNNKLVIDSPAIWTVCFTRGTIIWMLSRSLFFDDQSGNHIASCYIRRIFPTWNPSLLIFFTPIIMFKLCFPWNFLFNFFVTMIFSINSSPTRLKMWRELFVVSKFYLSQSSIVSLDLDWPLAPDVILKFAKQTQAPCQNMHQFPFSIARRCTWSALVQEMPSILGFTCKRVYDWNEVVMCLARNIDISTLTNELNMHGTSWKN